MKFEMSPWEAENLPKSQDEGKTYFAEATPQKSIIKQSGSKMSLLKPYQSQSNTV